MKRLILLLMTLVICEYGSAQFIIAGDTNAPDILYKSLNKTLTAVGPPPGIGGGFELDYEFNVNDQGPYDFIFTVSAGGGMSGQTWSSCSIRCVDENQFCVTSLPFLNNDTSYVKPFNNADTIGINNLWYNSTGKTVLAWTGPSSSSADKSSSGGIWNSLSYKYLGISIKIGDLFYYGWIQMKVRATEPQSSGATANIYLKNSAITKSNIGINNEEKVEKYRIYPNPVNEKLTIELLSSEMGGALTLYNNNSQPLITKELTGVKTELDLDSYARGVYYLVIKTKNKIVTRKIMIE